MESEDVHEVKSKIVVVAEAKEPHARGWASAVEPCFVFWPVIDSLQRCGVWRRVASVEAHGIDHRDLLLAARCSDGVEYRSLAFLLRKRNMPYTHTIAVSLAGVCGRLFRTPRLSKIASDSG